MIKMANIQLLPHSPVQKQMRGRLYNKLQDGTRTSLLKPLSLLASLSLFKLHNFKLEEEPHPAHPQPLMPLAFQGMQDFSFPFCFQGSFSMCASVCASSPSINIVFSCQLHLLCLRFPHCYLLCSLLPYLLIFFYLAGKKDLIQTFSGTRGGYACGCVQCTCVPVHVGAGGRQQTPSLTNSLSYILGQSFSLEIRLCLSSSSNWPTHSAVPLALPPTPWNYRQLTMSARHCVQIIELWFLHLHNRHFIYRVIFPVSKLATFLIFCRRYIYFLFYFSIHLFILHHGHSLTHPPSRVLPLHPPPTPTLNSLLFHLHPGKGRSSMSINKTWLTAFFLK